MIRNAALLLLLAACPAKQAANPAARCRRWLSRGERRLRRIVCAHRLGRAAALDVGYRQRR